MSENTEEEKKTEFLPSLSDDQSLLDMDVHDTCEKISDSDNLDLEFSFVSENTEEEKQELEEEDFEFLPSLSDDQSLLDMDVHDTCEKISDNLDWEFSCVSESTEEEKQEDFEFLPSLSDDQSLLDMDVHDTCEKISDNLEFSCVSENTEEEKQEEDFEFLPSLSDDQSEKQKSSIPVEQDAWSGSNTDQMQEDVVWLSSSMSNIWWLINL